MIFLRGIECRRNLQHDFYGAVWGETPRERERLAKVPAGDVVHHYVVEFARLVIAAIVHRNKVGVADSRRNLRLTQKPLYVVGVFLRYVGEKRLERVYGVKHLVPDEIDGSERAVAEKTLHHVAAEPVAYAEYLLLAEIHFAPPIFTTIAE